MRIGLSFVSIESAISNSLIDKNNHSVFSLDCWGTLINPNKRIWQDVSVILRDTFSIDPKSYSIGEITRINKQINSDLDARTSLHEREYNQFARIEAVCKAMGIIPSRNQIKAFIKSLDLYFLNQNNAVLLIEDSIFQSIRRLKNDGKHIVLLSNTGFVSGKQTRDLLHKIGLLDLFDEIYLSDEIGASKPSSKLYDHMINDLQSKGYIATPDSVIHFGDNRSLDYLAALYNGLSAVHIDVATKDDALQSIVEFDVGPNGHILTSNSQFGAAQYSRLKFGVMSDIKVAAKLIYEQIIQQNKDVALSEKAPLFLEAYRHILPAGVLLVREVQRKIDGYRSGFSLPPTGTLWAERLNDDLGSYSHLHAHKRSEILFDDFYVHAEAVKDKLRPIIALDDVYVSGSFTSKIRKAVLTAGFTDINFLYLSSCHEEGLLSEKSIEYEINNAFVQTLGNMDCFLAEDDFLPTRKYYKLLLTSSDKEVRRHLSFASSEVRRQVEHDLELIMNGMPSDCVGNISQIQKYLRANDA